MKRSALTFVSLALVCLGGCGGTEDAPTPAAADPAAAAAPAAVEPPAPAADTPAADTTATGAAAPDVPADVCARAVACCAAYAAYMPEGPRATAQAACDTQQQTVWTGEGAEAACRQSIENYRHGIEFLEEPVPPVCR